MSDYNRPNARRGDASGSPQRPASRFERPAAPASRPQQRPSAPQRAGATGPQRSGASPQRPAPRQSAPAARREGPLVPHGFWLLLGAGVAVILVSVILQYAMPSGFPVRKSGDLPVSMTQQITEIHGGGPVRLNEIMTSNGGVLMDNAGLTSDWVEVANIGTHPVNLQGYLLSRSSKASNVFVFPDRVLQPGECAVVFCDSTLTAEVGEELHAPFRLSSDGDTLMLFNDADVAIDTVNIPALAKNVAYVREDKNSWRADEKATPGMLNNEDNYLAMTTVTVSSDVKVWEIVASNTRFGLDENGVPQDYVILRNTGAAEADLSGWYLSDNVQLNRMWKFPQGTTIPAGGTLLVHCSGANRVDDPGHLHTNFGLSSEGEQVALSNASGQLVDLVNYDLLKTDTAYRNNGDGTWSVGEPTAAQ